MQNGNYMKASEVLNYLETKTFKFTLASVVKEVAPLIENEWYSTKDLQNLITPTIFRQMECQVTTYMFHSEFDKAPINPF